MKVLGRELVSPFGEFWADYRDEIGIAVELVERGHSTVFDDQGADVISPELPKWLDIPDDDFAYHVAHQLTHILLKRRGFPSTGHGPQYPSNSFEAQVGGDIEELVIHPPLDDFLCQLGFSKMFITDRMIRGARSGLATAPVPEPGTPWFFTWAIRYCEMRLELGVDDWAMLQSLYDKRAPDVAELGEELVSIMRTVGWGYPKQAVDAMIQVRDSLGLGVEDRVLVVDSLTGRLL